ncbi:MAG: amidohydrolase family protein [Flavobacteriales bacterium]|nr:amidohydrolase family protein [Flavobacteriales bacterium]
MSRIFSLLCLITATFSGLMAQTTFPINGVQDKDLTLYAFTNATIHVSATNVVKNATLLVQEGRIVGVGAELNIPKGAVVSDLKGKHIYPSLIDAFSTYGVEQPKKEKKDNPGPQYDAEKPGAFAWNDALNPEANAAESFKPDAKKAKALREAGFGATISLIKDGIARGRSALVLTSEGTANEALIQSDVAANYSFSKGTSTQNYPSSQMGAIALLRQTYFDAEWYAGLNDNTKEMNLGLEAWNANQNLPQVFDAPDLLSILRADKVGDEFGKQYVFIGNGTEYRRIDALKSTGGAFILPMKLPDALDVEDPYDAQLASYEELLHWELAPTNTKVLDEAGIEFAFTLDGLEKEADFWKGIRIALEHGLDTVTALEALTSTPAKLFGLEEVGTLEKGKLANFLITSKNLFDEKNSILEHWLKGKKHVIQQPEGEELSGTYQMTVGAMSWNFEITGTADKPSAKLVVDDSTKLDVSITVANELVSISFKEAKDAKSKYRLSGRKDGKNYLGNGKTPDGTWVDWSLNFKSALDKKDEEKEDDKKEDKELGKVVYPFMAYGYSEAPKQGSVVIRNATVWTNEADGILENTDIHFEGGKIKAIGKDLAVADGTEDVNGTGKHVTAGVIDEHSHIAISRGVNEGTQAVTAEVSIGDVVNSEDVNIYRQLAGGVTASQLLHGSANPIGGQSGIVKLRWGKLPEEMKIANAAGHIKFALGENVKQSNWGEYYTSRFPQTRMGVEQVFYDAFYRAKAYKEEWAAYNGLKKKDQASATKPRRDIELDVIAEIMDSKRFVTCHSYVQSEINMLMSVADSMGWKMNTFTHILEGYKVADKMKAHGVNGSTFSDWWAYKFEVNDAIPYNAALMHEAGVNVGINSDDAEMGRRLNQEAAKGVKYGGMTEEEAWKMVTLNPAKMLKLENQTGSLKAGKDADVVVWSANPLSVYAKAERTYVDGTLYYSIEKDKAARLNLQSERNRIIQKMIAAKKGGAKTEKPSKKEHHLYHCDTLEP